MKSLEGYTTRPKPFESIFKPYSPDQEKVLDAFNYDYQVIKLIADDPETKPILKNYCISILETY